MKIRYSILSGLLFAIIMFVYIATTSKMDVAIVVSTFVFLISSFLFYFKIFSNIDFKNRFQKVDSKKIIHSGLSNHYKDGISVGGTLYLLNDKLIFQTNLINFANRHQQIIFLNQISEISFKDTMGFIGNGLLLKNIHGEFEDFIVNKRDIWKELVEQQIASNNLPLK